jgi:hypothetical protein
MNQLYPAAIARLYCMELLGKKKTLVVINIINEYIVKFLKKA